MSLKTLQVLFEGLPLFLYGDNDLRAPIVFFFFIMLGHELMSYKYKKISGFFGKGICKKELFRLYLYPSIVQC